jgi:hypothetical protein
MALGHRLMQRKFMTLNEAGVNSGYYKSDFIPIMVITL